MLLVIHIKMMVKEDEKNFSLTKSRIIPAAPSFAPRTTLAATEAWWDSQVTRKRRREGEGETEGERPTFMGVFPPTRPSPPHHHYFSIHPTFRSPESPLPSPPHLQCMRVEEGGWGRGERERGNEVTLDLLQHGGWGFYGIGQCAHWRFYNRFSIKYVTKFVINAGNISLQIGKWIWIFYP